jgi:hypothetical protein
MENYNEEKYNRAKKKVKKVKDFYSHLTVYIVVNIFLILMHMGLFENGYLSFEYSMWSMFTTPIFWGIGLLFHALYVFQDGITIFKKWEERKLKKYMEEDENEFKRNNKWE